jgi:hypothetical protein
VHIAALILPVFAAIVSGSSAALASCPIRLPMGWSSSPTTSPCLRSCSAPSKESVAAMFDLPFLATFGALLIVWAAVSALSLLLARRGPALATVDGLAPP